MNEDLMKLCQLNALEERVDGPQAKEVLRQRIARQAKIVSDNIANEEEEEDDD